MQINKSQAPLLRRVWNKLKQITAPSWDHSKNTSVGHTVFYEIHFWIRIHLWKR